MIRIAKSETKHISLLKQGPQPSQRCILQRIIRPPIIIHFSSINYLRDFKYVFVINVSLIYCV
jgi:hypothetical protein